MVTKAKARELRVLIGSEDERFVKMGVRCDK